MRNLFLVFFLFNFSMSFGQTCIFYIDADMDGYGDDFSFTESPCDIVPPGTTLTPGDCDDFDPTINPCGVDNNLDCNDMTSSVQEATLYFEDQDGDGYGNADMAIYLCESQTGFIPDGTDCDDQNSNIHPNAVDIVGNDIDENCDGLDGVGIAEELMESIEVWPNPMKDILHIETPMSGTITITNIQGQWILEQQLFAGVNPIQLDIESGYYWAIIKSPQGQWAKKIFKV